MPATRPRRARDIAAIHATAAKLGMDTADPNPESEYRSILWTLGRVRSSRELDYTGLQRVRAHLTRLMLTGAEPRRPRPAADRERLVAKIRAMLHAAGRTDAYADGMARRMFRCDRYEWLTPDQLRRLVAALEYDARRRRAGTRNEEGQS